MDFGLCINGNFGRRHRDNCHPELLALGNHCDIFYGHYSKSISTSTFPI